MTPIILLVLAFTVTWGGILLSISRMSTEEREDFFNTCRRSDPLVWQDIDTDDYSELFGV